MFVPSLQANGSRECAPDDRLREAIQAAAMRRKAGLLRRFAPRNDEEIDNSGLIDVDASVMIEP
jgi:hypothetical protein